VDDPRIAPFLVKLTENDDFAALSEAKIGHLRDTRRTVVIEENDTVVAVGAIAEHRQADGSSHWSVETALEPGLRFAAFEDRLLASTIELVPDGQPVSVWSHRDSLDLALTRAGFIMVRELAHMATKIPVRSSGLYPTTRNFEGSDTENVINLNRVAFSTHREAASLDEAELQHLLGQAGMGPSGFIVIEEDDALLGFCWTRVHENGDGEIFRIAVSPQKQGAGLGRSLAVAGFDYLATQEGVSRGTLWVDLSNRPAVSLYENLGMTTTMINREFELPTG
jgi:mycothiol synthase